GSHPPLHVAHLRAPPPTNPPPLSLHDALPICIHQRQCRIPTPAGSYLSYRASQAEPGRRDGERIRLRGCSCGAVRDPGSESKGADRKSTRLNSSHGSISYAVLCLQTTTPKTRS